MSVKKTAALCLALCLCILFGCSSNGKDISDEVIIDISDSIVNGYFPDEGEVILSKNTNEIIFSTEIGVFKADINSGKVSKLFDHIKTVYDGEKVLWREPAKLLDFNGGYAVVTESEIFYYNDSNVLISHVPFDKNSYGAFAISPDGKTLAYGKGNDLCISDINLQNGKTLLKGNVPSDGNEMSETAYGAQRFSADGKGVWCNYAGYEWLLNVFYVDLNGNILLDTDAGTATNENYEYLFSDGNTQYLLKGDDPIYANRIPLEIVTYTPGDTALSSRFTIEMEDSPFLSRCFSEKTKYMYFYQAVDSKETAIYKTGLSAFAPEEIYRTKQNEYINTMYVFDDFICLVVRNPSIDKWHLKILKL